MVDYKDTLHLPSTDFAMRANLAQKEPAQLSVWRDKKLYEAINQANTQNPLFVLHDGPPYANGHLHHGHILNKILKDMVVKDRTMSGYRVPYVPGWDCHGLPIEVQVDKELGSKKGGMSKVELRQACRAYAERFVQIQREEFERLGVFGRWQEPYLTMSFAYEAATLRELARIVDQGLVYKGLRPVNWCSTHQTALAEAEIEYEDHKSPSVYVAFAIKGQLAKCDQAADLVIWTTTPWTLPANLAIAVHADYDYIAYPAKGRVRIVATDLLASFLAAVGEPEFAANKVIATYKGRELENIIYQHPLVERENRVLLGEHVTLETGTGLVHIAPGHGAEDFDLGRRYGLEILSPVDARGEFTEQCGIAELVHKNVFACNTLIAEKLASHGALLNSQGEQVSHRYAHCWRCHRPIITRATEQWWVAIDKPYANGPSLRERALASLKEVKWIPNWGEDRIRGMLATRPDWCLSRQRMWGVPIAVVYCEDCGEPVLDGERMRQVATYFEQEGADAWFLHSVEELMGPLQCTKCKGKRFRKEQDILDVWFDSGVSFAAVIEREGMGQQSGASVDLYLEGSDQHRGWFHSSLLCALATREQPPYKSVLTHGFVVDGNGKKISKSKGNFTDPFKAIARNGAEILRLWVAAEDYREDIRLSDEILTRLTDTYRKVRNTFRYLLGNLFDFDPNKDLLSADKLLEVDRYALGISFSAIERMRNGYERYEFHQVVHTLNELCIVDLSAFYLDILKDRLYASGKNSRERHSAQTVLYILARDLLRVAAPLLSFTCEEAWAQLPRLVGDADSVHLNKHPGVDEPKFMAMMRQQISAGQSKIDTKYNYARELRRQVNALLEDERKNKRLGSSIEARVCISGPLEMHQKLGSIDKLALADLFIVSEVEFTGESEQIKITIERARGTKCPRCWLYREDIGKDAAHPELCARCTDALVN
ncbi:MAG: isoleucine--tRNA ligase [Deltaproteobacteria bacterium]|nr:isoleucine--tRNA ligase [Deltaproteobacteria bacterium]